jgi:hypothetical protein
MLSHLSTKSHDAEVQPMIEAMHAKPFVWSKIGPDAGQKMRSSSAKKRSEEPEASFGGALARPSETASSG